MQVDRRTCGVIGMISAVKVRSAEWVDAAQREDGWGDGGRIQQFERGRGNWWVRCNSMGGRAG